MAQTGKTITLDNTDWERATKNIKIRVANTESKVITMTCRAE